MTKFRLNKPEDIRRTLQKISEMVVDGSIDTKQANCVIYACQTALTVLKTEELIKDNDERRERNENMKELFGFLF